MIDLGYFQILLFSNTAGNSFLGMSATLSLELAPMSGIMVSKGRVSLLDMDKTLSKMVPPTDAPTSIVL